MVLFKYRNIVLWSSLSITVFTLSVLCACSGDRSLSEDELNGLPNILFISIDDLRNDMKALGIEHAKTPNLDAFAAKSRLFSRHFAQAPSCNPSRTALLSGQRPEYVEPSPNRAYRNPNEEWADRSLPSWFRQHGYTTLALGKISHHPGGLTGKDWAEGPEEIPGAWNRAWVPPNTPWNTPLDMMHGYANGASREKGVSPAWEAYDGPDESYPDAWVANEAVETLEELTGMDKPWFFAVGFFKPHLPFAAPKKWYDIHDPDQLYVPTDTMRHPSPSSWHPSGEMLNNYGRHPGNPQNDKEYAQRLRHGYAAAISYMDAQVGRVLERFEQLELDDNTIVVIWSDHGFALGEQAIWGKHSLYEVALRSPMMIWYPGMDHPGGISDAVVEAVDLYPTLTDLAGLSMPDSLPGISLRPQLADPEAPSSKPAFSFITKKSSPKGQASVRTDDWRLIMLRSNTGEIEGYELFDFRENPKGTRVSPERFPDVMNRLLEYEELTSWKILD